MAAQQGFVYEVNAAKYLKPIGLVPKNFTPAGVGHDQPDLMLLYKDDKQGSFNCTIDVFLYKKNIFLGHGRIS